MIKPYTFSSKYASSQRSSPYWKLILKQSFYRFSARKTLQSSQRSSRTWSLKPYHPSFKHFVFQPIILVFIRVYVCSLLLEYHYGVACGTLRIQAANTLLITCTLFLRLVASYCPNTAMSLPASSGRKRNVNEDWLHYPACPPYHETPTPASTAAVIFAGSIFTRILEAL